MKNTILSKSIITAVLSLSISSVSHAGTVYLTGSTAARGNVYNTLAAPGVIFTAAPVIVSYGNATASKGTYMAFKGTLVGGTGTTIIDCDWSGSEAGYSDLCTGTSETFIDPSTVTSSLTSTSNPPSTVSHAVDLAMADNAQSFSRTQTPVLTSSTEVGVITFKWVRNNGLWTGANVTDAQIQDALSGFTARALFDGNPAHGSDYVYVSGRDHFSGTRVNAFGDTGFGIFTTPSQIEINSSGVMQQLDTAGDYIGDFGYSSGGTLAATMGANTTTSTDQNAGVTGFSVIAYLGFNDAATAITAGATELTYDGILFSPTAVEQGQYTFWGNEYVNESNSSGSEATSVFGLLGASTGISSQADGSNLISLSAMTASRNGPTSPPIY